MTNSDEPNGNPLQEGGADQPGAAAGKTGDPLPSTPQAQAEEPQAQPQPTAPFPAAPEPYQQPPMPDATIPTTQAGDAANPDPTPAQPQTASAAASNPYAYATQQPCQPGMPGGAPLPPTCPQQGYPQQPWQPAPYGSAAQQAAPKKRWPWILTGCLVALLLLVFAAVSCTTCVTVLSAMENAASGSAASSASSQSQATDLGVYTLQQLKDATADLPGTIDGTTYSGGLYVVGTDIAAGRYYLEGSQAEESNYYLLKRDGNSSTYVLDDGVAYFGNYFVDLQDGDALIFWPADDTLKLYPEAQAPAAGSAPYQSGCYRVGTDLPAGTYTITANAEAAAAGSQDSGAFAMKDLAFNQDSIVDGRYVIAGGTQTITVTDGQLLELYAATATPAS